MVGGLNMKKHWGRTWLIGLLCLVMVAGCAGTNGGMPAHLDPSKPLHSYQMTLELDEKSHTLTGDMTIVYQNPTNNKLKTLPFSLYPNAYASEKTAPFFAEEMQYAYPNGFSAGGIEITSISAGEQVLSYQLGNKDKTRMDVQLQEALDVGESIALQMKFTVTLPNSLGRFGYGEKAINLCNFYPIACPYVNGAFLAYPYYAAGDPFVSNLANYQVELTVPQGMTVAHSGNCKTTNTKDGKTTYSIIANNMRDFAAVASKYFAVGENKVGNVTVRSYYYQDTAGPGQDALIYGSQAIKAFTEMIGSYAYDTFSVVQTDFFIGGMEYPGLVLIDQSLYTDYSISLEEVVVHETAHQWWYAAVGNDQVAEPWLDEALTDYVTKLYYGHAYDQETEDMMYYLMVDLTMEYYQEEMKLTDRQLKVGRPSSDFDNSLEYSLVVYLNGNKMLHALQEEIGRDKMLEVLQTYYKDNIFTISTKQKLLDAVQHVTGEDYSAFFKKWL